MFAASKTASLSGYQIQRSLRFNSADSAYLNRTPASAGNRTTWTWSAWIKRSGLSTEQHLFEANSSEFYFVSSGGSVPDSIVVRDNATNYLITSQVFRDVSAWYHIVLTWDSSNATAGDRVRLYVNGSRVTAFGTSNNPTLNQTSSINSTNAHFLGEYYGGGNYYFNGYMTEVNFVDGQALTPSSFGITNPDTGVWQPKAYTGTYGTNGFYLNFSDNSNTTATTLGKDYSGNGNNWTPNNFSVSAGAGNDSLVDVPTAWGTDTGVGGSVRGNYCTLNPLKIASTATLSNGNLDYLGGSGLTTSFGTIGVSSGKWYFEATPTGTDAVHAMIGVANDSASLTQYPGQNANSWGYYGADGYKYNSGSATAYGAAFGANDVIGVALDMDAGTLTYYKNGVSQGQAFSGLTGTLFPVVGEGGTQQTPAITANFGQRPFAYTAPSGFKALCTQNLPTPTVGATASTQAGKFFNPVLYTGTAVSNSISGVGFQPDMVWIKRRDAADNNVVDDAVRGAGQALITNSTVAEQNYTSAFTAFNSDGFTVTSSFSALNASSATYVAWNWKANGAGVTNTAGSITSTVSANTTSGFSVVTFTSQASGTATVGHGLGAAPKMVIVKGRNVAYEWYTYHASLGASAYVSLSNTAASASSTTLWNATSPTSSVFSLGTAWTGSNTFVAYCFAEVPGFSKFGSYTGNGSTDGPFVYCGFRPAFVMIKASSDGSYPWMVFDRTRNPSNVVTQLLLPNASDSEYTVSALDFTANGFKLRDTNTSRNNSGTTYIFAAFAEFPQKFSLAR